MDNEAILSEGTRRRVYWTMQRLGVGQTEIEEKAGIGFGTLSNFFKGRRGNATSGSRLWLLRIADALDVDYGWLSTGRRPDPSRALMDLDLKPIPPIPRGRRPAQQPGWVAKSTAVSAWTAPTTTKKRR